VKRGRVFGCLKDIQHGCLQFSQHALLLIGNQHGDTFHLHLLEGRFLQLLGRLSILVQFVHFGTDQEKPDRQQAKNRVLESIGLSNQVQ